MAEEQRGFLSRLFGGRDDAPEEMPTDFFSLPMGANPKKDRVVGMDESGLPQYESPLGVRYIIRPTMPAGFETEVGTLARVAEVGRDAIEGTIDGVVSGFTAPARAARGEPVTYGDALATAGTASLGGAASSRPAGSVGMGGRVASDEIAETPAQTVARLLREDRAQEVTDDLLAQTDPQEMYRLYEAGATGMDMPMDEASRMARAREMGFDTDAFHATTADFQAFDPMRRGSATDAGWFGDADYFSPSSSYAERFVSFPAENPSVIPTRLNRGNVYDWRTMETERGGMGLGNNAGAALETRARLESEGFNSVEVSNPIIRTDSPLSDEMWSAMIAADPRIERFGRENASKTFQGGHPRRSLEDYFSSEMLDLLPTQKVIDEIATFSPTQVRSRFARFDPRLSGNANLLAANRDATTGIMAAQAGSKTPDDFGIRVFHASPQEIEGDFRLSNTDVGLHFANNPKLAENAAVKSAFERPSSVENIRSQEFVINATPEQIVDIPASANRFDFYDVLDSLYESGRIDQNVFNEIFDGLESIEDLSTTGASMLQEQNKFFADSLSRNTDIRALRYMNEFDAGPTWRDFEQGQTTSSVTPDYSYIVLDPAVITRPSRNALSVEQEDIPQFNRGGLVLSDATKGIRTVEGIEMAKNKFQLDRSKADKDGDGEVSKLEEIQGEAAQRTVGKDDLVEMACGGIMMPDMDLDPISGNEVPLGSTPENVRDDIPAMLSQDEYVLPAHVVKWHGLKHIQEMQMEAEAGLMSLSMEGLIGGQPVEDGTLSAEEKYAQLVGHTEDAGMEVTVEDGEVQVEDPDEDFTQDEYIDEMDVEVDIPTVEVEDELEGEEYEEEPFISTLPGMMKKQKYAFIIS